MQNAEKKTNEPPNNTFIIYVTEPVFFKKAMIFHFHFYVQTLMENNRKFTHNSLVHKKNVRTREQSIKAMCWKRNSMFFLFRIIFICG